MNRLFTRILFLLMFFLVVKEAFVNAATKYLFWQQTNDACILAAAYNLNRLETLKQTYQNAFDSKNISLIPDSEWFSHREWFGKEYLLLKAWHESVDPNITFEGTDQDQKDANVLKDFLGKAVSEGPVGPYVYDKKGKILFGGYFEKLGIPFFLYDYEKIPESIQPELGIFAPIVQEKGSWYAFSAQKTFVAIPSPKIEGEWKRFQFDQDSSKYPAATKISQQPFPPHFSIPPEKFLGFDTVAKTFETAQGLRINNKTYVPYLIGLYKLILLTLGIDNNNNVVPAQGHTLSPVCNALNRRVSKDPNNPWNPIYLSRDKVLQYELTKLFLAPENKKLYEAAKATVNCLYLIQGFHVYSDFQEKLAHGHLYKKINAGSLPSGEKEALAHTDDGSLVKYGDAASVNAFLPGEEQALAYYVTQTIYFLWYGSMAPLAVLKIFGIEGWRATCALPAVKTWIYLNERSARKKMKIQDQNPQSFMDVWQQIVAHFRQQPRKSWYSFDAHGWVVSFDQQLFDIQQEYPIYNKRLFDDLGIAVIESWIGRMLPVFYKK